jgi:CHASE1-domain containing sensor protein
MTLLGILNAIEILLIALTLIGVVYDLSRSFVSSGSPVPDI